MDTLNDAVLTAVQNAPIDDYGQRSALGMARSWLENHKPIKREVNSLDKYVARDDLAEALVAILEGTTKADAMEALARARGVINAPFLDPNMNGQKVGQAAILKPGGVDHNA